MKKIKYNNTNLVYIEKIDMNKIESIISFNNFLI